MPTCCAHTSCSSTTYRGHALEAQAYERLREVFGTVCADVEADFDEIDGESDPVRLLVRYRPKIALAGLVDSSEGVSSQRLRAEGGDIRTRGAIPWSPLYVAGSVGGAPLDVLRRYIERRDAPR